MAYECLNFQTPVDMLLLARQKFEPHPWQVDDLTWLAGYRNPVSADDLGVHTQPTAASPARYVLCAANNSGKDSVIGAGFMIWFICTRPRAKVICTSASALQVFEQTEKPARMVADALNAIVGEKRFRYVVRTIEDTKSGSSIRFFATDEPGKAEGDHPNADYDGAEMAVVANEVKTIGEHITEALERNHGYNYWLEYSSPGEALGHFYNSFMQDPADNIRISKVTAYDCPHIPIEVIDRMIKRYGINHPLVRSSIFAEFTAFETDVLISPDLVTNYSCLYRWKDRTLRAGIDLGLGGDVSVMYVYMGPIFVDCITADLHDAVSLASFFIMHIRRMNIQADNVNVDGSGIGKPIISIFHAAGCNVLSVKADERPRDKGYYLNRGAEVWDKGKMILQCRAVELPSKSPTWAKELTTRRAERVGGKVRLENKRKARLAGRPSPNFADAWMLVFARLTHEEMGIEFDSYGKVKAKALSNIDSKTQRHAKELTYDMLLALSHGKSIQAANKFRPKSLYGPRR